MSQHDLEAVYDTLAEAIDAVGPEQSEIYLAKVALALAERLGNWDAKLEGLTRLRGVLGMPSTDILIDPLAAQFPVSVLDCAAVELFDIRKERSSRFVHAKAFIACGKKWDHVISGSMNCSLPALLGRAIPRGNAELGLYKRVERGMALRALKLDGYQQTPLDRDKILPRLKATNINDGSKARDGGAFTLQGHRLDWTPPSPASDRALSLQLYDRDSVEIGDPIQIDVSSQLAWKRRRQRSSCTANQWKKRRLAAFGRASAKPAFQGDACSPCARCRSGRKRTPTRH